jgi:hypothetical protein
MKRYEMTEDCLIIGYDHSADGASLVVARKDNYKLEVNVLNEFHNDDAVKVYRLITGQANLIQKHGYWYTLTDCANAGTYCSVCNKKVYKEHYANVKEKSSFCPNCGSIMDGKFRIL